MTIIKFITEHWDDILALLTIVIGGTVGIVKWVVKHIEAMRDMTTKERIAYVTRLLENLKPTALYLVTEAEVTYGDKTGPLKKSFVMDELYRRIPEEYRPFITEENLAMILENALDEADPFWQTIDLEQIQQCNVEEGDEY